MFCISWIAVFSPPFATRCESRLWTVPRLKPWFIVARRVRIPYSRKSCELILKTIPEFKFFFVKMKHVCVVFKPLHLRGSPGPQIHTVFMHPQSQTGNTQSHRNRGPNITFKMSASEQQGLMYPASKMSSACRLPTHHGQVKRYCVFGLLPLRIFLRLQNSWTVICPSSFKDFFC